MLEVEASAMLTKLTWCLLFGLVVGLLFPNPVAAQRQIKISGYVKDADGNPYSGVAVFIGGPLFGNEAHAETSTNERGHIDDHTGGA